MLAFTSNTTFTLSSKIGTLHFGQQAAQLYVTLNADDKLLKLEPSQVSFSSRATFVDLVPTPFAATCFNPQAST